MNLYKVLFPNRIGDKWFNQTNSFDLALELEKIEGSDKFILGEVENDARRWNNENGYDTREIICSEEHIKLVVQKIKEYCQCEIYYFKDKEVFTA